MNNSIFAKIFYFNDLKYISSTKHLINPTVFKLKLSKIAVNPYFGSSYFQVLNGFNIQINIFFGYLYVQKIRRQFHGRGEQEGADIKEAQE